MANEQLLDMTDIEFEDWMDDRLGKAHIPLDGDASKSYRLSMRAMREVWIKRYKEFAKKLDEIGEKYNG